MQPKKASDAPIKSKTEEVPVSQLTFEQAIHELEEIIRQLEMGNIDLESAIERYSRGEKLKEHCQQKLASAKLKVEKIVARAGQAIATETSDLEAKATNKNNPESK
jgi:exodeoxyribonuclease VII small subunit